MKINGLPLITATALGLFLSTQPFAQTDETQKETTKRFSFSGNIVPEIQVVNDVDSSKFNEYRDIKDGVFVSSLRLGGSDEEIGNYLELRGKNVFRDDQNFRAQIGKRGRYQLRLEWDKIPHNLSDKAKTPYQYDGSGLYTVPTTIPQSDPTFIKKLAGSATEMTNTNDPIVATYLTQNLKSTHLENSRNKQLASFEYLFFHNLKLHLNYSNEDRKGNRITRGPIGDRPPRTLNIQMPEPIDYKIQEFKFEADYVSHIFQLNASYMLSDFKNHVDTMTWQNIFTTPGATFDLWVDKHVGTFGRRSLPPDNKHHTASLTFGLDLPKNSRLGGNVLHGWMRQNESLLPYSTVATTDGGIAWNDIAKLTRTRAGGRVDTQLYELNYSIRPLHRLHLRGSARYFDLDNKTPQVAWKYVTQDTMDSTGSVNYVNNRMNVAYAHDQRNYLLDGSYGLHFWKSTLGGKIEREEINRTHREGDTDENIYELSLRSRPKSWLNFRVKSQYRKRAIDSYNTRAHARTYTYPASAATTTSTNFIDPQFTFDNHPDTRVFDVTDRIRQLFEFHANLSPWEKLAISGSFKWRRDNFDSDVTPSKPLLNYAGNGVLDDIARNAQTPGDQIGLLSNKRALYGLDASYPVTDRLSLTAFMSYEDGKSKQRGIEYNENLKGVPGGGASSNLGPWTRGASQWIARIKDRTHTIGLFTNYVFIPDKLKTSADLAFSQSRIDIRYSGFGTQSSLPPFTTLADNTEFAFRTPPTVYQNRTTANLSLTYQVIKEMSVALGYMFEHYHLSDWQQKRNTPWGESVNGSKYLIRDTSRSSQWGNRLIHMGIPLAPSYTAHVGMLALDYRF